MADGKIINVMGTLYQVDIVPEKDDPKLETMDGYTDPSIKRIVVSDVHERPPADDDVQNMEWFQKNIIRHELIHAFVIESGCQDALWHSEEMVRWLAYMFPRLLAAFNEAGALYERLPKPSPSYEKLAKEIRSYSPEALHKAMQATCTDSALFYSEAANKWLNGKEPVNTK